MIRAHINRIGTAVPAHDIHAPFIAFARTLLTEERQRIVFDRMAERSGIAHRYAVLQAGDVAAALEQRQGDVGREGPGLRCAAEEGLQRGAGRAA